MQAQIRIKTVKTVSEQSVHEFDNKINELIKADWQILGPPVVIMGNNQVIFTQQFGMFEQIAKAMM